jgi:hypothetical protein
MGEHFSFNPEETERKLEDKAKRLADSIRKLEKGVISEANEATQIARGTIRAMGFGVTPLAIQSDDNTEE